MNAYLRKEIRLLLPSLSLALLLALSAWLIPPDARLEQTVWFLLILLPLLFCPALLVMAALDSFGRELSFNTFANLLSQPVSRSRVWWTKTTLLAASLLLVFGVWWLSFTLHLPQFFGADPKDTHETFVGSALWLVTAYSSGLWTVLLLRHVGTAFWCTLIVPAALAMGTAYLSAKLGPYGQAMPIVTIVLLAYSVAGFFWGRRLFLRAQDVNWTGGEIALPGWLRLPKTLVFPIRISRRRPRLALIVKEFQLHQSQFVIAAVLALVHLALILVRKTHGNLRESVALEFVAYQFWLLWGLMPLLIGCAAVAEERRLGTLESHLCLPERRRTEFLIKLGVAVFLAVLFGMAAPVLIEGGRILPDTNSFLESLRNASSDFWGVTRDAEYIADMLGAFGPLLPMLPQTLIALLSVCLAFHVSSLARNTFSAIAPAIMSIILAWVVIMGAGVVHKVIPFPIWHGWLIYLIGVPVLTTVLARLTYWNFKHVQVGWPVWRRNLAVLVGTLVLVTTTTTAIYQRAWELLRQLEPAHGPARLAATEIATMSMELSVASIQFADGRSWSGQFHLKYPGLAGALFSERAFLHTFRSRFLSGSNWANVVQLPFDVIGLQKDGSLWVSEDQDQLHRFARIRRGGELPNAETVKLVRYGNDSDWKNLTGRRSDASVLFALKSDGTLWRIGTNRVNWTTWPGLGSLAPQRAGVDADWSEISMLGDRKVFRKLDGRVYVHPALTSPPGETVKLDEDTVLERAPHLEQNRWRGLGLAWPSAGAPAIQVGVAGDGTFQVAGFYELQRKVEMVASDVRLSSATNWAGLAAMSGPVVTLKADGTLWLWKFTKDLLMEPESASATQLGRHSDWIAVTAAYGGVISLAADGTLWYWHLFPRGFYGQKFELLRPSRKPQLVGNIFAQAQ